MAFSILKTAQARPTKKNYLLNGAMMVAQETLGAAITTNGAYPIDQWVLDLSTSGGAVSVQQVAKATPAGSPNRLRVTVTAAQATIGSGYCILRQPLEGFRMADLRWGTAAAKTATVQVGVNGPAGTYRLTVPSGDFTTSVGGTITIAAGEANTDVVKTLTIVGPTSGNWPTNSACWGHCQISLAQSGSANLLATNGAVFELFDVSMNEGSYAPSFVVPDFVGERSLCQRYWEKSYDYSIAVGTLSANGSDGIFVGSTVTTFNTASVMPRFKVPKRTAPTVVVYAVDSGTAGKLRDRAAAVDIAATVDLIGENGFRAYGTITANGQVALYCHWIANSRM